MNKQRRVDMRDFFASGSKSYATWAVVSSSPRQQEIVRLQTIKIRDDVLCNNNPLMFLRFLFKNLLQN